MKSLHDDYREHCQDLLEKEEGFCWRVKCTPIFGQKDMEPQYNETTLYIAEWEAKYVKEYYQRTFGAKGFDFSLEKFRFEKVK